MHGIPNIKYFHLRPQALSKISYHAQAYALNPNIAARWIRRTANPSPHVLYPTRYSQLPFMSLSRASFTLLNRFFRKTCCSRSFAISPLYMNAAIWVIQNFLPLFLTTSTFNASNLHIVNKIAFFLEDIYITTNCAQERWLFRNFTTSKYFTYYIF